MNRKTFITAATSVASAVVLFSAPAQAQLLGGGGGLAGNLGGNIGRGATSFGGSMAGDGRLSGTLPRPETGRVTGAAERVGERGTGATQAARERTAAAGSAAADRAVTARDMASDRVATSRDIAADRVATTRDATADKAAAAQGRLNGAVDGTSLQGGGTANGSVATPARSVEGGGNASGSGSVNRSGAYADVGGSARATGPR